MKVEGKRGSSFSVRREGAFAVQWVRGQLARLAQDPVAQTERERRGWRETEGSDSSLSCSLTSLESAGGRTVASHPLSITSRIAYP